MKSYHEALSRGEYPYLPSLDEILSQVDIVSEVSLGLVDIPTELIVGTYTKGRKHAFAPNFMPIMSDNTEFAAKWANLMTAHSREGIHDAVTCYEYMNHYYVIEGNKRVSVLKFCHAPSIQGIVTRLVPRRSRVKENIVYYEYLNFYRLCPAVFLLFSAPGDYKRFLALSGHDDETVWSEDDFLDLKAFYWRFSKAFEDVFGTDFNVPVSDALLSYLEVYPYQEAINEMPDGIAAKLFHVRDEILMYTKKETVRLITEDTAEAPGKGFFEKLLSAQDPVIHAAFLYLKTAETSAWVYGNELGRKYIEDYFGDQITTKVYENVDESNAYETIEKAVNDGADIIFATTPRHLSAAFKAAVAFPDIKILVCSLNEAHRYIRTYYARIYEAKFLSGIIAGALTENDKVGFVADYPGAPNLTNINAFALGVKTVNPRAKVYLSWPAEKGSDTDRLFSENDVRIISGRDNINPSDPDRYFGLYALENGERKNLAMTVWNWGVMYRKLIESVQSGAFENLDKTVHHRAVNYWWGMASDVIDLIVSEHVPTEVRRLVNFLSNTIRTGEFTPFYGIIHAQNGVQISSDPDYRLTPKEIMNMNWLLDNIVGHIPELSDMTDEAKALGLLLSAEEFYEDET